MRKSTLLTMVDAAAFAALTLLVATGALIHLILPPGSGHGNTIWGLDRHEWGEIHFSIALTFLGLMVLHLLLHWAWIVHAVRGENREKHRIRILGAVVVLVILATAAASPFFAEVTSQRDESPRHMRSGQGPKGPKGEQQRHGAQSPRKAVQK